MDEEHFDGACALAMEKQSRTLPRHVKFPWTVVMKKLREKTALPRARASRIRYAAHGAR
jgi:hypothetical protein